MGRVKTLRRKKGPRFAGYAYVDGREVYVDTFATASDAELAVAKFEVAHKTATGGRSPVKGKITFAELVETYFDAHLLEPSTRTAYRSTTTNHLLPALGGLRIRDIDPEVIGRFLREQDRSGRSLRSRVAVRSVLSSILGWAATSGILDYNPVLATRPYKKAPLRRRRRVMKKKEWAPVRHAISGVETALLVDTALATGLRWGEVIELRVENIIATGPKAHLYVTHAAARDDSTHRVLYRKEYTKGVDDRRVPLRTTLLQRLRTHIRACDLAGPDLLFDFGRIAAEHDDGWDPVRARSTMDARFAAKWEPLLAAAGRCEGSYLDPVTGRSGGRHGKQGTYTRGCRCSHCRYANAVKVRARRLEQNGGAALRPGKRLHAPSGWVEDWWFREHVWHPATHAAGMDWLHFHDLRHAFGEWLVEAGTPVRVVQEWMGHSSVTTTEIYLANVTVIDPEPVDQALAVMDDVLIDTMEAAVDPQASLALEALSGLDPDQLEALLDLVRLRHSASDK